MLIDKTEKLLFWVGVICKWGQVEQVYELVEIILNILWRFLDLNQLWVNVIKLDIFYKQSPSFSHISSPPNNPPFFWMPKLILIRFISVQREIHVNKHVRAHFSGDQGDGKKKRVASADDKMLCQILKGYYSFFRYLRNIHNYMFWTFGKAYMKNSQKIIHTFPLWYVIMIGWGGGDEKILLELRINISPCSL